MSMTTLHRIAVVSSNAGNLCALLNVADEQDFLKNCMSPKTFQECIQGGDTNTTRVQILCEKIIQEMMMAGSMKMYDALCEYFLKKSEAYKSMHQRFTAIGFNNSGSRSSDANSPELLLLQERVKYLTEEVLYWRNSHSPCANVCQIHSKERNDVYANNKSKDGTNGCKLLAQLARLDEEIRLSESLQICSEPSLLTPADDDNRDDIACLQSTQPITAPPQKQRLTDAERLEFTHEGLSVIEADAAGCYPPISCVQGSWGEILREENKHSATLLLPPLLLNEEIIDSKVPIIMYVQRMRNELRIHGGFHGKVPAHVLPLNFQLELTFTFTKNDNTKWTVDKQIIATVGHGTNWRIFTLYDFPFPSLSSLSPPAVPKISIRKILPEQKWYYTGLAPRFGRNGKFDTIRSDSLEGTFQCAIEWKKMVENGFGNVSLPPLLLTSEDMEDMAVCCYCRRKGNQLQLHAKYHPSTPNNLKVREILFKVDLHVSTMQRFAFSSHREATAILEDHGTNLITFDLPSQRLSPFHPPRFSFQILPVNG